MVLAKEETNFHNLPPTPEDLRQQQQQQPHDPNIDSAHVTEPSPPTEEPKPKPEPPRDLHQYQAQIHASHLSNDPSTIANAAIKAATEAATETLKHEETSVDDTFDPTAPGPFPTIPSDAARRALENGTMANEGVNSTEQSGLQTMDIHDATGTLLQQFSVNGEADAVHPTVSQAAQPVQAEQQGGHPDASPGEPIHTEAMQTEAAEAAVAVVASEVGAPAMASEQPSAEAGAAVVVEMPVSSVMPISTTAAMASAQSMREQPVKTAQAIAPGHVNQQQGAGTNGISKKPARMPGTKQCPSCQNTIAAAVAKCPKCPHVFREKKEKVKRSGKRGKKNCPKCQFENPSACSSCKNCKHVFRLKLMDRYKAMRPRQPSETAAAAAAAAAHAAANMAHATHAGITAVSTVPLPAGVATYPNQMAQSMAQSIHPGHMGLMQPVGPTLSIAHPHQVHGSVPQIHLPQQGMPMQHHQTHPQL